MKDIKIVRGRDRTALIPQTERGRQYISATYARLGAITIGSEHIAESLVPMREAGLDLDEQR